MKGINMLKFLFVILSFLLVNATTMAQQAETITIVAPHSPSQNSTPFTLKLIEKANFIQAKYNFVVEFKPGAMGVAGIRYMDSSPSNRIVGVAPAFIENTKNGLIVESDYVPVSGHGDVCWALISNIGNTATGIESLSKFKGKEVTVGGTGIGNAAHVTALMLGEKYGFTVKYVVFKSNFDAVVNIVGDNGVNLALENISTYHQFKEKQPNLQMLGLNCSMRSVQAPGLKTLREQGVNAPIIFNMLMANKAMPVEKRKEIGAILDQSMVTIGPKEHAEIGGLYPPIFQDVRIEDYAKDRIHTMKKLVAKYQHKIAPGSNAADSTLIAKR